MSIDMDHLGQWVGRAEERTDIAAANAVAGLAATLDRDDPAPVPGDALPPGAHWLYFHEYIRQSDLAFDGHAHRGGFLPPVELPRRMWAGGRIAFPGTLKVGEEIRRVSTVTDVTHKQGKSGDLIFVLVRHEVFGAEGLAVREEHDIVYRGEPDPAAPAPPAPAAPEPGPWQRQVSPDTVMLFRYSALTFNGHKIHFDHEFTTGDEGYEGLLVHGPLIATLLMDLCRRQAPERRLVQFDYRARSPLFAPVPFTLHGRPSDDGAAAVLWAANGEGGLAMTAEAAFEG